MKIKLKTLLNILMVIILCFGTVAPYAKVSAQELSDDVTRRTGRLQDKYFEASHMEASDILPDDFFDAKRYRSAIYNSEWDKYSSNYYYNLINAEERAYWDRLDMVCANYLLNNVDAVKEGDSYRTGYVSAGKIDIKRAQYLASIFRIYNPQYYFLQPGVWYGTQAGNNYCALSVYGDFANGSARKTATASLASQINAWQAQIASEATDADKVKRIHDLICGKVYYNNTFLDDEDEERWKSQSVYSVFCMDTTVCAGYAMSFSLLCNGNSIDCISITSDDHQWNKVRIKDSWYNVDCTWDDGSPITYTFFEKNDAYMNSLPSHTPEALWNGYLPQGTLDSGSYGTTAGRPVNITNRIGNPGFQVQNVNGTYYASFTAPSGAYVYYTVNGGRPSAAATKSYRYGTSFAVSPTDTIRALAVRDAYLDSAVQTYPVGNYIAQKPVETSIQYRTHIQDIGWESTWRANGQMSGTSGQSKRLEGIEIALTNPAINGGVIYRTHIQDIGWENAWRANGQMSGTSGQAKRLEAIQIQLTGDMASRYDIYYRVHAQNFGWLDWAMNGQSAGTAGYGYRLEGIEIRLVGKGAPAPGSTASPFRQEYIQYRTHVQDYGWQTNRADGAVSGTSGESKRLEGICISLNSPPYGGGVVYRTHIQDIGWESAWRANDQMSGTSGQSKRLEAIQLVLTGEMANHYDVYYQVHAQNIGWLGWAKNGEPAGTAGFAYRLEAIRIVLVPKGAAAPGSTMNAFVQN